MHLSILCNICVIWLRSFQFMSMTLQTPWIGYVEAREAVVLRYFSAHKAEEFYIPALELRIRDPKTGKIIANESTSQYKGCTPVKFEPKGNYGVAIIWSDGFYADIYSFAVLREIADELKHRNQ